MPLVRISAIRGKTAAPLPRVGDAVHRALVQHFGVPADDRFQVLSEHDAGALVYDADYMGGPRSDGLVLIAITVSHGRTVEQKRALYRGIAGNLAELGVRREDVWINLVEVARENWSFGHGIASYAP